jgi:hypothetical protein
MRNLGIVAVGQVGVGCMAGKGYLQVTEDQREAKNAELTSIAEMKKQQEAAAAAAAAGPRKPKPVARVSAAPATSTATTRCIAPAIRAPRDR